MAIKDLLTRLLSLVAFIIILIVIFAGTQSGGGLDDIYTILLDVARLKTNTTVGSEGKQYATEIGAYDFYTAHVLNYCAGFYNDHGERTTTVCTKTTLPFSFDVALALLQDMGKNSSVGHQAIDWPYAIISGFVWVSSISKAVSVLSILNIGIMGIGLLVDGLVYSPGKNCELYTSMSRVFSMMSLVLMTITATIFTFCGGSFVEMLNMHGELYGIKAEGGHLFLALTWISVTLCLLRNLPFLATTRITFVKSKNKSIEEDCGGIRLLDSQQHSVGWCVSKTKTHYGTPPPRSNCRNARNAC